MAEQTTSQQGAPVTPPNGQATPASTQEPRKESPPTQNPPASTQNDGRPSSQDKQPDVVRVEDFRRMQSTLTAQAQREREEKARLQQQMQAMQQQLTHLTTKDMEPDEAEKFRANQYIQGLQAEIARRDQELQQHRVEQQANSELLEMASTTGVPFTELKELWYEGKQPPEIWKHAFQKAKDGLTKAQVSQGQQAVQRMEEMQAAARTPEETEVDLGQGRAPRDENPFEIAEKNRDTQAWIKAYLKAK